jgi:hypothetical protein
MGLLAEGFRYTYRAGVGFNWTHPGAIEPGDVDCTDMNDEEFERAVREAESDPVFSWWKP